MRARIVIQIRRSGGRAIYVAMNGKRRFATEAMGEDVLAVRIRNWLSAKTIWRQRILLWHWNGIRREMGY